NECARTRTACRTPEALASVSDAKEEPPPGADRREARLNGLGSSGSMRLIWFRFTRRVTVSAWLGGHDADSLSSGTSALRYLSTASRTIHEADTFLVLAMRTSWS